MVEPSAASEPLESRKDSPLDGARRAGKWHRLFSWWNALLARRGMISFLPILVAIFILFYGASGQIFAPYADATRYQCYAQAFWQGDQGIAQLPVAQCSFLFQAGTSSTTFSAFSLVPFEYPPLTLSIFSLPLMVPLLSYQIAFALCMAGVAVLIYWLLQRYGPRGSALAYAFYLALGAFATAEARFDLVPAGLTLLCLIFAGRRRWALAYVALALAVLLKIYPLLLLPALFLAEQLECERIRRPEHPALFLHLPGEIWRTLRGIGRWRWRHMLLFWTVIVAISGLFALLNFQGALVSQLSYFADRPVQIESSGSTLLWLASLLGHPASVVYTFGSYNIVSDADVVIDLICEAVFALGCVLVILWQWRGRLSLAQSFPALLLVFVVTGKVFSPQYLIWLIPLLAYCGAFNRCWLVLWGSLSVLTIIIYPYYYMHHVMLQLPSVPGFISVVTLRNALLVLAGLLLIFSERIFWPLTRIRLWRRWQPAPKKA